MVPLERLNRLHRPLVLPRFSTLPCGPVMLIIIINKVPRNVLKTLVSPSVFKSSDFGLVCLMLNVPVNKCLVMLGRSHSFLGITSTLRG